MEPGHDLALQNEFSDSFAMKINGRTEFGFVAERVGEALALRLGMDGDTARIKFTGVQRVTF